MLAIYSHTFKIYTSDDKNTDLQTRKFKEVVLFRDVLKIILYVAVNLTQKPTISHGTREVAEGNGTLAVDFG